MAKNWAIVVGINKYDHGISPLKYANRDAEAMANFFREDGFDRVFCFADGLMIPKEKDQKSTQPKLTDLLSFLHDLPTTLTHGLYLKHTTSRFSLPMHTLLDQLLIHHHFHVLPESQPQSQQNLGHL